MLSGEFGRFGRTLLVFKSGGAYIAEATAHESPPPVSLYSSTSHSSLAVDHPCFSLSSFVWCSRTPKTDICRRRRLLHLHQLTATAQEAEAACCGRPGRLERRLLRPPAQKAVGHKTQAPSITRRSRVLRSRPGV